MPVLTWFERAALLLSGYAMMRPTWRTYKEEGIRPAARSLIWNVLAWLTIALLVTQPTRPSTAAMLKSAMPDQV